MIISAIMQLSSRALRAWCGKGICFRTQCQTVQNTEMDLKKKRQGLWTTSGSKVDLTQREADSFYTARGDLLLSPSSPAGAEDPPTKPTWRWSQEGKAPAPPSLPPLTDVGPFVQQLCHICVGCLPSPIKRHFCFKHFSTKTASDNTEFLETLSSLFCKKSGSASALILFKCFSSLLTPVVKSSLFFKHVLVFPVFHTANFSQFESQITSGMLCYNVLFYGIHKDNFG